MEYEDKIKLISSLKKKKDGVSPLFILVTMCMELKDKMANSDDYNKDIFGNKEEYLRCLKDYYVEKILSIIFKNS